MNSKRLATFATLLSLSACVGWMPTQRTGNPKPSGPPGGDGRSVPGRAVNGRQAGLATKVVRGKREPVTLIADDKTECIVPESKFKETAIGEKALCAWSSP